MPAVHCSVRRQKGLHAKILPCRNGRQGKRLGRRDLVPALPADNTLDSRGSLSTWTEPVSFEGDQQILHLLTMAVQS